MSPEARLAVANTGSSHRGGEGDHLRENSKYTRLNAKRPRVLISTVHKSQCTERTLSLSRAPHRFQYMYIWTKHKTPYGHARSRRRGTSQRDVRRAICMQGHEGRKRRKRGTSKRVCTHARAAACTIRAAAVAKMGRGARCSSSVSVSRAARADVTRPAGGG